jgi:small subunit ribosomal protein S17
MADQENNETTPDETPAAEEPAVEAPAAADESPVAAEEAAAAAADGTEPEVSSGEPEPAAAAEPDAPVEPAAPAERAAPAAPAEPAAPPMTPQERRVATRAKRGRRRASTPEERLEVRRQKATARRRRREQERAKKTTKGEGTPPAEHGPGSPQVRLGKVVSDKADKTITVRIDVAKRHRRYRKIVRSSSTVHAHDERNDANEGDLVRVVECRPMSRTKRWRLVDILERAR